MEKWKKVMALLLATGLACFGMNASRAQAFHDGGVGNCSGCHSMHTSSGLLVGGQTVGQSLLRGSDPSSICLNCHAGFGAADSPSVFSPDGSALTPGGDFYWLGKSYSWSGGSSPGYSHGHNVVALDFNLQADPVRTLAPGGTYPAAKLSCISCHDPHGQTRGGTHSSGTTVSVSGSYGEVPGAGSRSGNYRLLGDSRYVSQGVSFLHDAPVARQNPLRPFAETDTSHVAYGSGMSEWCANCHAGILNSAHQAGGAGFEHPAGAGARLEAAMVVNYNTYIRTGDLTGTASTAYLQFVPFERGVNDPSLLDPTSTGGPDSNANVMCLTCHRAHASAFRAAGRWDFDATLLVDSHPALGDSGVSGSDVLASYYGRNIGGEFGSGQAAFCEKCHPVSGP